MKFAATVSGTGNQLITWSLTSGSTAATGSISKDGLYVAPAGVMTSTIVTVVATSAADSATSTAIITISPAAVAVTPAAATVETGAPLAFTAIVTGLTDKDVIWSVNGLKGGSSALGIVSALGVYVAPAAEPSSPVLITATSVADPNVAGSATLNIVKPVFPQPGAMSTYGPGLQFDVLDNMQAAQGDVDYRFRAAASSAVTGFIWYDVYVKGGATAGCSGAQCECDGYGCGTGGTIDICIYTDDGSPDHLPTDPLTQQSTGLQMQPLACASPSNLRSGTMLRTETFTTPPQLIAGTLYHLHWHNADPDPAKNFVSVDDDCVWHPSTPRQPNIPDADLAVLSIYNNGEKVIVTPSATDTPIYQLNYADGTTQGQGYIGSWNGAPADITGASEVREQFTVSGADRTVSKVSVRVNRVAGSSSLTVTLATSDGNILEQGEIPASQFPLGEALTSDSAASENVAPAWGSYTFASPHLLALGQSYQLILSSPDNTKFQSYGIEKGSGYNFAISSYFNDGYGQFSLDNGNTWTGFTEPDGTLSGSLNHTNADMQFYFVTE
jgi:hypothetical protein